MGATLMQTIAFAAAAYVYSKPEVYTNAWAWALLPTVVYLVYSFLDGSELTPQGRYWPAFQKGAFSVIPDMVVGPKGWFSGQIKYDNEAELKKTKQCIFAAFPHGVVSFHHVLMASDSAGFISKFPHLSCHQRRDLAASVCFKVPLWRELLLWLGGVDAGRATACSVLRNGWSLYILPGGEAEQLLTKHGEHHVFLNRRRGFVKLAIQYGVDLVPVYSFGETDAYETYSFLFGVRWWICKNLRVALPLARGIGPTLWPRRVQLHCVVGTPIRVTQSPNPSDMTVAHLHTRFTTELKALFDKHKAACGHPDAELVVH